MGEIAHVGSKRRLVRPEGSILTGQAGHDRVEGHVVTAHGHSEMTGRHVVRVPMGRVLTGSISHGGGLPGAGKGSPWWHFPTAALMVEGPVVGTSMVEVSGDSSVLDVSWGMTGLCSKYVTMRICHSRLPASHVTLGKKDKRVAHAATRESWPGTLTSLFSIAARSLSRMMGEGPCPMRPGFRALGWLGLHKGPPAPPSPSREGT